MTLTTTGFDRPRLAELKTQIDDDMTDALGPVNTSADALVGQLDGIWAEGADNNYEVLQDTYDAMYPYSAEGTSLDGAVSFIGLTRLAATATAVTAAAYGTEGTLIAAGNIVNSSGTQFTSTSAVVISRANALDVTIDVNSVENSSVYSILAGGTSFTYTSSASATAAEIAAGFVSAMNADPLIAELSGSSFRVYAYDGITPFSITVDTRLTISKRGSPVVFVCSSTGAVSVPVGALSNIDTPVNGWDSVSNLAAGDAGRDVETDTELRIRHLQSTRATGSATVEAIKAKILADVDSVTSVQIYENRTNITNSDGMPPHSYQLVIVGGTNSVIADEIWLTKPAGIETYGNISVTVLDTAGDSQVVSFSRPTSKYGWVSVAVTALDTEETLPATAVAAIKQAVLDYANSNIGVGDDIILQRFYGPIYDAVTGIGSMTITIASTAAATDTPTYVSTNITIGRAEIAMFDLSRITVTGI